MNFSEPLSIELMEVRLAVLDLLHADRHGQVRGTFLRLFVASEVKTLRF